MALGLGRLRVCGGAGLVAVACSAVTAPQAKLATQAPTGAAGVGGVARAAPEALALSQLFLVRNAMGAGLMLRALGSSFQRQLASRADLVLYDSKLELLWFTDEDRLWVIDLRQCPRDGMSPVLIASGVAGAAEIGVDRGSGDSIQLQNDCDLLPVLWLHWFEHPWIELEDEHRTELEGVDWLSQQRSRKARVQAEERSFDSRLPRAALPLARAHCDDLEVCGATLPFLASTPWKLVLTDQSEGDCLHLGCLFQDSVSGAFGTPPQPTRWDSASDMPSGPCGPYQFNADGSAFIINDVICNVGGTCQPLGAWGVAWLAPGVVVGALR